MKKIYTSLTMLLLFQIVSGQTYTHLANDPQGDNTQSHYADIKSLSYSMDLAQDSIWFNVETFNAMDPNGDVGLMFGFDTNLVTTDGLAWNGNNHSMSYDQSVLIFQDNMSPNYYGYLYNSTGSMQYPATVLRPDSFTFIIRFQLSPIDQDGNFNLLFGSGSFDIISNRTIDDDVPNNGFLSVASLSGISDVSQTEGVHLYPNPATSFIKIENSGSLNFGKNIFYLFGEG